MEWLTSNYPSIKSLCLKSVPEYWPALAELIRSVIEPDLPVEVVLPLAACKAVGGDPRHAVPVASAMVMAEIGLRILDDLADQDKDGMGNDIGMGRTCNYGAALNMLALDILKNASWPPSLIEGISHTFIDAFLMVAAGQDRDLGRTHLDIKDYWLTMDMKTATAYSTACSCGALAGTGDPEQIAACAQFGKHLGLCIQIINDLKSIWLPDGIPDIRRNKITLPVIYGLGTEHAGSEELQDIISTGCLAARAEHVKKLLDAIDTRKFLVWAALKEQENGLSFLDICQNEPGRTVLKAYITDLFTNIDTWLGK